MVYDTIQTLIRWGTWVSNAMTRADALSINLDRAIAMGGMLPDNKATTVDHVICNITSLAEIKRYRQET